MSKVEKILGDLLGKISERRASIAANPGDPCPKCASPLVLEEKNRTFVARETHFGGGYAHASSFRAGLPDDLIFEVSSQVICSSCDFQGRLITQEVSVPDE